METVSFDLAKKLKEKGYPQEPKNRCQYYEWDRLRNMHPLYTEMVWYESENKKYLYSAPTISQVLKWLREEKRIEVNACWDNKDAQWIGYASEMDKPDLVGYYTSIDYDSYEQATLAEVEYVLDNLI